MIIPEIMIVVILGLVLGSFTTAMIYRIPRGHPWAFAFKKNHVPADVTAYRSACPSCLTRLKSADLIPVFSWAFRKGRCAHCEAPISIMYPMTELSVVAACLLVYAAFGFTVHSGLLFALIPFLIALLVIDLDHMILPNELVLIAGALGLVHVLTGTFVLETISIHEALMNYGLGAVVYAAISLILGLVMTKVLKKEALGFGDVKFFAVAGLWLGLANLSWFCILSGALGVVFAGIWQTFKKSKLFPFGPALILSLFVLLLIDGSLFS